MDSVVATMIQIARTRLGIAMEDTANAAMPIGKLRRSQTEVIAVATKTFMERNAPIDRRLNST